MLQISALRKNPLVSFRTEDSPLQLGEGMGHDDMMGQLVES